MYPTGCGVTADNGDDVGRLWPHCFSVFRTSTGWGKIPPFVFHLRNIVSTHHQSTTTDKSESRIQTIRDGPRSGFQFFNTTSKYFPTTSPTPCLSFSTHRIFIASRHRQSAVEQKLVTVDLSFHKSEFIHRKRRSKTIPNNWDGLRQSLELTTFSLERGTI